MLSEATKSLLNGLHFRPDAKRMVSLIPLASIYWEDEMPDFRDLMKLSEEEQNTILRLFGIRLKIWDDEPLSTEEELLWEAARSQSGNWALFSRLILSADNRCAREQVEQDVEKELVAFFIDADQIVLKAKEGGIQEFSATFDLTKKPT